MKNVKFHPVSFLFLTVFLLSCEKKKTGNDYLLIMSFDPLDYYSNSIVSAGLDSDTTGQITTVADDFTSIDPALISQGGSGLSATAPASLTVDTSVDTITTIDLTEDDRQAFISVADRNVNSCTGAGVLSNVTCSLDGFFIDIGALLVSATDVVSLSITGTNVDHKGVDSNVLEARKIELRQISAIGDASDDNVQNLVTYKDDLYFQANKTAGTSFLTSYNGATFSQVANIAAGTDANNASPLTTYSDKLLVTCNTSVALQKLCTYDGTTLSQILDIDSTLVDQFNGFAEFKDKFYISARASGGASDKGFYNIYKYDGTNVSQITNSTTDILIKGVTSEGIYYLSNNAIYRLDPGASNANVRITPTTVTYSFASDAVFFVINDKFYFTATPTSPASSFGMFVVDGTDVKRLSVATTNVFSGGFSQVSVYDNIAYGVSNDGTAGYNLYKFNGSRFERLNPSTLAVSQVPVASTILATANGVYFVNDPAPGSGSVNEMYRFHSRRFEKLFDLNGTVLSTQRMFEHKDEFYFVGSTGAANTSLFRLKAVTQ